MLKEFIVPLDVGALSLSEFSQFHHTTIKSMEKTGIKLEEHAQVNQAINRLRDTLLLLEPGIKQEKPVTGKELMAADKKRDLAKKHLDMLVDIASHSRNANKQVAANDLNKILANYRQIHRENYEKQSKHMIQLIQRLEQKGTKEKVVLIGAGEQLQALKDSQDAFYQLYLIQTQHKGRNISKTVRAARTDIRRQYLVLYYYLICECYWNKDAPSAPLLAAMNDCRKEYAKLLSRRSKKNKTKTDGEDKGEQ